MMTEERVLVVPATREESLANGEPPMRDPTCVDRNTATTAGLEPELKAAGQLPAFAPGGYSFRDGSVNAGTGTLTMSAATMTRLLQMMHPGGSIHSDLPGNRFTVSQLQRMASKQEETLANGEAPTWSLGGKTRTDPTFIEFSKGGTLKSGRAGIHHFTFWPLGLAAANMRSMSIAVVSNCAGVLASSQANSRVRTTALKIFQDGGWDNDVDLYPELGLV